MGSEKVLIEVPVGQGRVLAYQKHEVVCSNFGNLFAGEDKHFEARRNHFCHSNSQLMAV